MLLHFHSFGVNKKKVNFFTVLMKQDHIIVATRRAELMWGKILLTPNGFTQTEKDKKCCALLSSRFHVIHGLQPLSNSSST